MAARKGQQAREENYAARGGAVSNKKYHGRAKVIDSKRDSQGAVLVENLEPKYEGSVPAVAKNSRMTLEVPVKDSIEQHMKTSNRQTLLSSEKRDVFGVP